MAADEVEYLSLTDEELKELGVPLDIRNNFDIPMTVGDETIGESYMRLMAEGMDSNWAEMISMQSCPAFASDKGYIQDQRRHGTSIAEQYKNTPRELEELRKGLARNGYKLKSDDQYVRTAARFPNDPMAIVNETRSFSEVKKMVDERQKRSRDEEPMKKVHKLHPRLVEKRRQQMIKEDPGLAFKDQRELRERIVDKHGSKGN